MLRKRCGDNRSKAVPQPKGSPEREGAAGDGGAFYGSTRLRYLRNKVAPPAHRVKDKRLRRAFGILDTARWLCSGMVKGLLPTPAEQG